MKKLNDAISDNRFYEHLFVADYAQSDNWQGIALLEVVGKVIARVLLVGYNNWQKSYPNPNVDLEVVLGVQT